MQVLGWIQGVFHLGDPKGGGGGNVKRLRVCLFFGVSFFFFFFFIIIIIIESPLYSVKLFRRY